MKHVAVIVIMSMGMMVRAQVRRSPLQRLSFHYSVKFEKRHTDVITAPERRLKSL